MAEELRDRPNYYMDEGGDGHGMGRPGGGKLFTFVDCHCERPHVLSISWSVRKVVLFTLRTHTRMFDFISVARYMESWDIITLYVFWTKS